MAKIIKNWWVVVGLLLLGIYIYGYQNMFFHQDDLDWFILANQPFWGVMMAPIGDHVNFVWRLFLKVEWELFGLYFPLYLAVSVIIHGSVIWCLYKLAKMSSGRRDMGAIAALLFTINTNWTESVLWISGQTISITALVVLWAMLAIWSKKKEVIWLYMASWTSALAMGLLGSALLIYKKGLIPLTIVMLVYLFLGSDGTKIAFSWEWLGQVGVVSVGMMINSVIGRLLIPFDRFEMVRIGIVGMLMGYGAWRGRGELQRIWHDTWSRFLILQIVFYNLIVALGRAQYGIGIMRAERYAYLGLALLLLLIVRVGRKGKIGRWIWVVPAVIVVQSAGFFVRADEYVKRPQQMRQLFGEIKAQGRENIKLDQYLPHFVLNDERLKYQDLTNLMND